MNINLEELEKSLCSLLCTEISLNKKNEHITIQTPFAFPDGDRYQLYIKELSPGIIRLTDMAHTLMQLSYENDIDKFKTGTRAKIFNQILSQHQLQEDDGEIFTDIKIDEIGSSIFKMSQAINSIYDLTFLNRERVESTFYEDLSEIIYKYIEPEKVHVDYIYPDIENSYDYPIDYMIEGKVDPVFVFGIPNRDKARLATIVLERLLRAKASFESVLIFSDQSTMPRADLARLSNVGGEMVASLDAEDDLKRKITKRAA